MSYRTEAESPTGDGKWAIGKRHEEERDRYYHIGLLEESGGCGAIDAPIGVGGLSLCA